MIKFNLADCMEKCYFSHGMPCIKFAVGSKFKNIIESEKLTAMDPGINI